MTSLKALKIWTYWEDKNGLISEYAHLKGGAIGESE